MGIPSLSLAQIEQISGLVADYIRAERERFSREAESLVSSQESIQFLSRLSPARAPVKNLAGAESFTLS
jgi:hypothetical protein